LYVTDNISPLETELRDITHHRTDLKSPFTALSRMIYPACPVFTTVQKKEFKFYS